MFEFIILIAFKCVYSYVLLLILGINEILLHKDPNIIIS